MPIWIKPSSASPKLALVVLVRVCIRSAVCHLVVIIILLFANKVDSAK